MVEPRTLGHPPIKEAVLEVLLNYPPTVNQKFLGGYGSFLAPNYPIKDNIINISGDLGTVEPQISRSTIGHIYYSSDRKTYIQIRQNGFSFAQSNESYTSWENFKPLAFKELEAFADFIGPISAFRYSLRFINEIKIPRTFALKEYIRILPNFDVLNLPIRNFVSRVEVDKPEIGALAVINQLLTPPFETTINIFLDIDVMINDNRNSKFDLPFLSAQFDKLRALKNEIFFSSLTEKAIEIYK